jgi:hypothetical protein
MLQKYAQNGLAYFQSCLEKSFLKMIFKKTFDFAACQSIKDAFEKK